LFVRLSIIWKNNYKGLSGGLEQNLGMGYEI